MLNQPLTKREAPPGKERKKQPEQLVKIIPHSQDMNIFEKQEIK